MALGRFGEEPGGGALRPPELRIGVSAAGMPLLDGLLGELVPAELLAA